MSEAPVTTEESYPAVTAIPEVASSSDTHGNIAISDSIAAATPALMTATDAQGQLAMTTSISAAPVAAFAPVIISFTNADGVVVSTTSYQAAMIVATTDASGSQTSTTSPLPLVTVDGQGSQIHTTSPIPSAMLVPPALTLNSHLITANSLNQYVIGSQTLTSGGTITASGAIISLSPNGAEAVVGSITEALTSHSLIITTSPLAITIGTQTVIANLLGQYIFGSQTLTPGGVITASGSRVSLASDDSAVVVGTSTAVLSGSVSSGIGSTGETGSSVQPSTGNAVGRHESLWIEGSLGMTALGILLWL